MEQQKIINLSIVIPAYNEGRRIGRTLDALADFLKKDPFFKNKKTEVLVVAADSEDDTRKIVMSKQNSFQNLILLSPGKKVGKGRDVQFGMMRAKGRFIMYMDADLATPLDHIKQFLDVCQSGFDIVAGTRDLSRHHKNFLRLAISNVGNTLFCICSGVRIEDSQCGFKIFTKEASQLCFSKMTITGWSFDMEILTIAKANGLKVKTIRLNDWKDVPGGTFTDGLLFVMLRSLKDLEHIVKNRLSGRYTCI